MQLTSVRRAIFKMPPLLIDHVIKMATTAISMTVVMKMTACQIHLSLLETLAVAQLQQFMLVRRSLAIR